jgi:alpha-N-arabinofuranosidase
MHSFLKFALAKTLSQHPAVCLLFLLALPFAASSQTRIVNATIDTSKTGAPISKNIYGQFLEHGGDIVNTGVWSEMLVDRKFFYPVSTSAPKPPPVMGNAAGNPRFNRTPTRWWAPIGGDDVVTMDTKTPYTGDHTPLVKLSAKEPHGFSQSGIAVRKGKSYTGRIVLAGSPRRGGQGHAHLGQRSHRSPDHHPTHARRRVPQIPVALRRCSRHR